MPTLYIGNKNYSSWSLRPWVLATHHGIAFDEVLLPLSGGQADGLLTRTLQALGSPGFVPVWLEDDGFAVWDSLAIAEHLAERHPEHPLWPRDARQRSRARSAAAEMHSGFHALRQHASMNIGPDFSALGPGLVARHPGLARDLARLDTLLGGLLADSGGPFLMGPDFGAVDAFYLPVAVRCRTYGLPLSPALAAYCERLLALPAYRAWHAAALRDPVFLADHEDYRSGPDAPGVLPGAAG